MFNKKLGRDSKFKGSHGWLRNFKVGHTVHEHEIHGEKKTCKY